MSIPKEIQEKMKGNYCLITEDEFMKTQKEVVREMPKTTSIAAIMYMALYQTLLQKELFHPKEIEESKDDRKE